MACPLASFFTSRQEMTEPGISCSCLMSTPGSVISERGMIAVEWRDVGCIIRTASVASESRAHINFLRPPTKQLTRLRLIMYPCLTTVYRAKRIRQFANSYYPCAPIASHLGDDVTDSYQVPSRGERYHVK